MAQGTFHYGGHVAANGIRQHYLRFGGKGESLVVVPGITSPAATWAFVGERLGEHYYTYVMDVRGRGLSSAAPGLDYSLETYAADVIGFAAALGLQRFHLLGHSMGARIAARAATRGAPVGRLILADPPLSGPGCRPYVKTLEFYLGAIRQAQAGTMDVASVRATYPGWTEDQVRNRAEWLHTCDIEAISQTHRGFQEEEVHSDIAALNLPTQLMVAGRGGVILPEDVLELKALMPSIQVKHFPAASHMIPFDDLDGFISAAVEFLG